MTNEGIAIFNNSLKTVVLHIVTFAREGKI